MSRNAFAHEDQLPTPEQCPDATLAALAQLCALRLQARRVLITLMSSNVEYVLAESTQTLSLRHDMVDNPKDGLWLGTCCFARSDGMNDLAMETWRKARKIREEQSDPDYYYRESLSAHYNIVCDARNDPQFAELPFVRRAENLRFFCSLPIRGSNGSVIGSLSVLDDRPRYGISASAMLFLEDMTDSIGDHLEATLLRLKQQRSERLVRAIGLFNHHQDSLRAWWMQQDDERWTRSNRIESKEQHLVDQKQRADDEFGVQGGELSNHGQVAGRRPSPPVPPKVLQDTSATTDSNEQADHGRTQHQVAGMDFDQRPEEILETQPEFQGEQNFSPKASQKTEHHRQSDPSQSEARAGPQRSFDLTSASNDGYRRACNLMREALGAEGVVVVDANAAASSLKKTSRYDPEETRDEMSGSETSASESTHGSSTSDYEGRKQSSLANRKRCKILAKSTRDHGSSSGPGEFALSERHLRKLVKHHPYGKVFNFEQSGDAYCSSDTEAANASGVSGTEDKPQTSKRRVKGAGKTNMNAQRLRKVMVGAQTIAFYPIWDDSTERWRSCMFVWSTSPMRFFDETEDITYLSSFAHSITAELARLEAINSDRAKGTFISSISHELRSPLHGVLAGTELLQETELTPFQKDMALTVAVAGRTLLDTVNHVLDYSKISSLTQGQQKERAVADASRHSSSLTHGKDQSGEAFVVDLARLTEEVVESVVAAHRFQNLSKGRSFNADNIGARSSSSGTPSSLHHAISVTLDIEKRDNWYIQISPGAWTRVVNNVVGNALKYTQKGLINITLSTEKITDGSSSHRTALQFQVKDTGIGMSQSFVENDMFTPFRQQDFHAAGTGLGLSIVKQIASELQASLSVDSAIGKGTTVRLALPANFAATGNKDDADEKLMSAVQSLDLRRLHVLNLHSSLLHPESEIAQAVGSSVLGNAEEWLSCSLSSGAHMPVESGNSVCAIAQSDLSSLSISHPDLLKKLMSNLTMQSTQILVFARSLDTTELDISFEGFPVKPLFLHLPIGPRKLLRSLVNAQDSSAPRLVRDFALHDSVQASSQTPLVIRAGEGDVERGEGKVPRPRRRTGKASEARREERSSSTSEEDAATCPALQSPGTDKVVPTEPSLVTRPSLMTPGTSQALLETADDGSLAKDDQQPCEEPAKVLLVDDNHINLKLLEALAKKLKLPYASATNGLEALTAFSTSTSKFFMVLMDISMPVMDGNESTAKIREFERKNKLPRTFIVALTGVTSDESRRRCFDAGVDKYLTKPMQMKDLSALVAEVKGED